MHFKKSRMVLTTTLLLAFNLAFCQAERLTEDERRYVSLFNEFRSALQAKFGRPTYVIEGLEKATDTGNRSSQTSQSNRDSTTVDFIVHNYMFYFLFSSKDSSAKAFDSIAARQELYGLWTFIKERGAQNFTAKPLRLCKDRYVYEKLSRFQRENTLAVIDKNKPDQILLYMLFIPGKLIKATKPKIISWKLMYTRGIYLFQDISGNEGMEVLFDGIKGPESRIYPDPND